MSIGDKAQRIELADGKYTYEYLEGVQIALRYGEPWRDCTGDNLMYAMAERIFELQAEVAALRARGIK